MVSYILLLLLTGDSIEHSASVYRGSVALIIRSIPKGSEYEGVFCGGAVIDVFTVVTAAHCLDEISDLQIDVIFPDGDFDCDNFRRVNVAYVEKVIRKKDLAFLRLQSPASPTYIGSGADAHREVLAHGWSSLRKSRGVSCQPISIPLAIVDLAVCKKHNYPVSPDGSLCAIPSGEEASCFGDSGGPLFNTLDGSLVGITLGGEGCSTSRPTVYFSIKEIIRARTHPS